MKEHNVTPMTPSENEEESAREFSEWVKQKAEELGVSEDYFILEFI